MFEELEIVELTHDIKEHKLKKGDTGTVVLVYRKGKAYEVEFVAANGRTIAVITLVSDDIRSIISKNEYVFNSFAPIFNSNASVATLTKGTQNTLVGFDAISDTKEKKESIKGFNYPVAAI